MLKEISRKRTTYTCSCCKYESSRQFNVQRHEKRIHLNRILHFCCGKKFLTKGNYYIHCEREHPERRQNAITSRIKYKITRDSVTFEKADENKYSLPEVQLGRRYSKRIRIKRMEMIRSQTSLSYTVTYSDLDIEDMPLICFLTDGRLKLYMKRLSLDSSETNKVDQNPINNAKQTVTIAVSSEQHRKIAASENGVQEARTSVVLPVKKLILNRFRKSVVTRKYEIPLRELNNNDPNLINLTETTTKKSVSLTQKWPTNLKRGSNKENVGLQLSCAHSFARYEQKIDIKMDRAITVPVTTQLHRDFLAAIDFDNYKIF